MVVLLCVLMLLVGLACGYAFAWHERVRREKHRQEKAAQERARRAMATRRISVARPGTKPGRVSQAMFDTSASHMSQSYTELDE